MPICLGVACGGPPPIAPEWTPQDIAAGGKADSNTETGWGCIASLGDPNAPLCNLHDVSPGIYRGARPSPVGMKQLSDMGVKYLLNLELPPLQSERDDAAMYGITDVEKPMRWDWFVDDSEINDDMAIMADPNQRPIYVHCSLGKDRTGLIIGLHRVINEGWTKADAYNEMTTRGFRLTDVFLYEYFWQKTSGYP